MQTLRQFRAITLLSIVLLCSLQPARAQVLARPGWAGSGVTVEPWWRRAVFYHIQPALYQDSDGDGIGDLHGIAQRLDYIQSLGVDAIILAPPVRTEGFDDLAHSASEHHIRLLVELTSSDTAQARMWLNQGAAGVYVSLESPGGDTASASALHDLRRLTDSYPGERILITGPTADGSVFSGPQLTAGKPITATTLETEPLRRQLALQVDGVDTTNPLLQLSGIAVAGGTASAQAALDRTLATLLLTSRAAVLFDAGRELGLRSFDGRPSAMQWTPSNRTTTPKPVVEHAPAPKVDPHVYGTFKPYVAPEKPTSPKPGDAPVDPSTLPGFSTVEAGVDTAANGATANVAVEDTDPRSLLNLYRHLIALHHGNWSMRNGTQYTLNLDAEHTLLWIRRAPAATRTSASIVVACNLSGTPVELSLKSNFDRLSLREGTLRPLLTSTETALLTSAETSQQVETTEHFILPAFTIFLGELYHDSESQPATNTHKRKRH